MASSMASSSPSYAQLGEIRMPEEAPRKTMCGLTEFGQTFAASSIGNIVEWYDFAAFAGLSDILGEKLFPPASKAASLMEALAVFGAAFFMRPLGGAIFGYLGDTVGRKRALELSIVIMVIPSFCIGLLPTYDAAGWLATMLLVFLRLVQGVAVGGELVTAYAFVAEHAPNKVDAPAWTGLVLDSANCGTLSGIATVAIFRIALTPKQLRSAGWRFVFFMGLPIGLAGLVLRKNIEDSPEFIQEMNSGALTPPRPIIGEQKESLSPLPNAVTTATTKKTETGLAAVASAEEGDSSSFSAAAASSASSSASSSTRRKKQFLLFPTLAETNPLKLVYTVYLVETFLVAGVASMWCGGFYATFVWMTFYYSYGLAGLEPVPQGPAVNAGMLAVLCLLFVPMAYSTRATDSTKAPDVNARRALKRGQLGLMVVSLPVFAIVGHYRTPASAVFGQLLFGLCLSSFGAGLPFFMVHAFPLKVRVAAIGAAYNISQAIFAGAAPIVMTALLEKNKLLPGLFLVLLGAFSFAMLHVYEHRLPPPSHNGDKVDDDVLNDRNALELTTVVDSEASQKDRFLEKKDQDNAGLC